MNFLYWVKEKNVVEVEEFVVNKKFCGFLFFAGFFENGQALLLNIKLIINARELS